LLSTATVAQLLEREDFSQRMAASAPISMLEMMYPLLQAFDSVAVRADVEIGGTDQKFNLLLGRDVQRAYGQAEQAILTMPILVGIDGRRKMSKSLGNHIGVTDPPAEVYGKALSIPDEAMAEYYALLLGRALDPAVPPREAKRELARSLVAWLYTQEDAQRAEAEFDRVFVEHAEPEEIEELRFEVAGAGGPDADGPGGSARPAGPRSADSGGGTVHLPALIASGLAMSRSDARRLIAQGGVSLDGRVLGEGDYDQPPAALDGAVLRVGKRRFRRLRAS
jgi:tyrosyl-tRNA synthetase